MMTTKQLILKSAIGLTITIAAGGCSSSNDKPHDEQVDQSANLSEQNRLLVRWAVAENVYNGIAAERAVYPKDFDPGTAVLNRLGVNRVETLADASRDSSAPIVVVRGDATDALYNARIAAVKQELFHAGMKPEQIAIAQDAPVGGGANQSDRALLSYQRLMSDYVPKQEGSQSGGTQMGGAINTGSAGSLTGAGSHNK